MKKNEIIVLNDVEYTLELNRESFLQIDKICNIQKSMEIIQSKLYEFVDDIDDNYDPTKDSISEEEFDKKASEKEETLKKLAERSFFIWLFPNHKLTISQVKEILNSYLSDDEEKSKYLGEKLAICLQECINIREEYNKQAKNLKAQANK